MKQPWKPAWPVVQQLVPGALAEGKHVALKVQVAMVAGVARWKLVVRNNKRPHILG